MKIVDTNTNGTVAEILGGNRAQITTKFVAAVNPRRKDTIMTHKIIPVQYITNDEHAIVFVEKSNIANNPFEQMDWEIDSIIREIEWGD